jgi:hypothetical protein
LKGGDVIFRISVGPAQGNPFIERAIQTMNGRIPEIVSRALDGGVMQ